MNMRNALLGLTGMAAFGTLALPAAATDLCKDYPQDQWLQADAIKSKAEGLGYEVRSVGTEDGCWEVKGLKDGHRVEAYFDPVTGELVKTKGGS